MVWHTCELEESFEDGFIVHTTSESGPQGFIQWIPDWLKVTCHRILPYSADKLLKCFSRPFSYYKSPGSNCSPMNFWMLSTPRSLIPLAGDCWAARLLSNLLSYCSLVSKKHLSFLLLGNGVCCRKSFESFQVIQPQLWVWIKWFETSP